MKTNFRKNLKLYLRSDEIYQRYLEGELLNASDFDLFCINHCEDIFQLLEAEKKLKNKLNRICASVYQDDEVTIEKIKKIIEAEEE